MGVFNPVTLKSTEVKLKFKELYLIKVLLNS